jgi:type IV pilus assembly protein PilX
MNMRTATKMIDTCQNRQRNTPPSMADRQRGAVLLISLVVLVIMTLSALALIRSVNLTNLIAGNLAFRESALLSSERSTETAMTWLAAASAATLYDASTDNGYQAIRTDPATGQSWDAFWIATLADQSVTGTADVAGNTVSYVIQRLCDATGSPQTVNCAKSPSTNVGGSQSGGSSIFLGSGSQVYYRITTRVAGPRNTTAYTQTIVAI